MDTQTEKNCSTPSSECLACSKCGEHKPTASFARRARLKRGFNSWCKACKSSGSNAVRAKWSDERKLARAEAERQRYAQCPERAKANVAEWKRSNPSKVAASNAKRRASKTTAKVPWASQRYMELWYEVARLETARSGVLCHVDHIVPLVHPMVCGLHCEDNMQVLTASENCSKQNKFTTDWE